MRVSYWRSLVHPLVVLSARRPIVPVILAIAVIAALAAYRSATLSATDAAGTPVTQTAATG